MALKKTTKTLNQDTLYSYNANQMTNNDRNYESERREYHAPPLHKKDLPETPLILAETWFDNAHKTTILDPTAATLSTVSKDLTPKSRIILIKEITEEGFIFYSNYESQKGQDLEQNDNASLLVYWDELNRQLKIEGKVKKISKEKSEAYFHSRPKDSQIVASISRQSHVIESRNALETKFETLKKEISTKELSLPKEWGGYILKPHYYEFWQGRENRLHDRIRYKKEGATWKKERIQP